MADPRYWRSYQGCRCYDQRTGLLKIGAARRLGLSSDHCKVPHTGRLCDCPVAVYVGKRRAKIMAREEARRG